MENNPELIALVLCSVTLIIMGFSIFLTLWYLKKRCQSFVADIKEYERHVKEGIQKNFYLNTIGTTELNNATLHLRNGDGDFVMAKVVKIETQEY